MVNALTVNAVAIHLGRDPVATSKDASTVAPTAGNVSTVPVTVTLDRPVKIVLKSRVRKIATTIMVLAPKAIVLVSHRTVVTPVAFCAALKIAPTTATATTTASVNATVIGWGMHAMS